MATGSRDHGQKSTRCGHGQRSLLERRSARESIDVKFSRNPHGGESVAIPLLTKSRVKKAAVEVGQDTQTPIRCGWGRYRNAWPSY